MSYPSINSSSFVYNSISQVTCLNQLKDHHHKTAGLVVVLKMRCTSAIPWIATNKMAVLGGK